MLMTKRKNRTAPTHAVAGIVAALFVLAAAASPLSLPGLPSALLRERAPARLEVVDDGPVPLAGAPAADEPPDGPTADVPDDGGLPEEPDVTSNEYGSIDATLSQSCIVTVAFRETDKAVRCLICQPDGTGYSYEVEPGVPLDVGLTGGDGEYLVKLMEQSSGNRYYVRVQATVVLEGVPEQVPYLNSGPFVDYADAEEACRVAEELCAGSGSDLERIDAIYQYVATSLRYDKEKAADAANLSLYAPDLDATLADGKGICMDYAALAAGMLRSQGVPCKMIFGDMSSMGYHAWIEVWSDDGGWLDATGMYLEPGAWTRLDPTVTSSMGNAVSGNRIIRDDANYGSPRYTY